MANKIVLIHGLSGSPTETWGNFIDLLSKDKDLDYEVLPLGFDSPHFLKRFWKPGPSLAAITNGVLTDLKNKCDLESDEIILVGHSLGGLVVKKLLLRLREQNLEHKISKVCFYDVPHTGSGWARVGRYIAFRNRHLKSLCTDSDILEELTQQWHFSRLENTIRIQNIVAANHDVVSPISAAGVFRDNTETINGVDHLSIVKPASRDATSYLVLKKFILERINIGSFRTSVMRDLNDWRDVEFRPHNEGFVSDSGRKRSLDAIIGVLGNNSCVVRLTGASGLGKSRLLLEAIDNISFDESTILVMDAADYAKEAKEFVRKSVDNNLDGLLILENCNTDLHNGLAREVNKTSSNLKLVTIGYAKEYVENSLCVDLEPLDDETIEQLLQPILKKLAPDDVKRVARFAQGYPLMAILIAEQYRSEGKLLGSINDSSVVKKLIEGDEGVSVEDRDILTACSLFDVFSYEGEEAEYISQDIAGASRANLKRAVNNFERKRIANIAGRYARVIPKPLAITLAYEWWENASEDEQNKLITKMPDSLVQSFCTQATYLDTQPQVKKFSEKLFSEHGPFVQAEVLLTERGSKLFREFVEITPSETSKSLEFLLKNKKHQDLLQIDSEVRRNLVWGLEKLCFRKEVFESAATSLMLLATAENEKWSNNASATFCQLFRIHLSGTEASPEQRFRFITKAMSLNDINVDLLIIDALGEAIKTNGFTRVVGAEYQGSSPPLKEWSPKSGQEINQYLDSSLNFLKDFVFRGDPQIKRVKKILGHALRDLVVVGKEELLNVIVHKIFLNSGRIWPEALESIEDLFEYESNITGVTRYYINSWLRLFGSDEADFSDKLKLIVSIPSWSLHKNEDGDIIDTSEVKAIEFAEEVARDISPLVDNLPIILSGEQRRAGIFGKHLSLKYHDAPSLIESSLSELKINDETNISFIVGLLVGLHEKSYDDWLEKLESFYINEKIIQFFPDLMVTGKFNEAHLRKLIELIENKKVDPKRLGVLSIGRVTDHLDPNVLVDFCNELIKVASGSDWIALNICFMFIHANPEKLNEIQAKLISVIEHQSIRKNQVATFQDFHGWHVLSEKLLDAEGEKFALISINQILDAIEDGYEHSALNAHIKPYLRKLLKEHHNIVWPILAERVNHAEGMELFWIQELLERDSNSSKEQLSLISEIPLELIFSWCSKYPNRLPVFIARCIEMFESENNELRPSVMLISVLENYGSNNEIRAALSINRHSRIWMGSLVPHLESEREAINKLVDHKNFNVKQWAISEIKTINSEIEHEKEQDKQHQLGIY